MAEMEKDKTSAPETEAEQEIKEKQETSEQTEAAGEAENAEKTEQEEQQSSETADPAETEETAEKPGTSGEDADAAEPEAEETAGESAEKTGKKKIFGKKKEKKDKKDEKIEELTDRIARTMAEFDNYRKRTDKEKAGMYTFGARDVIEKILPVVDNFERGLATANPEDPFAEGMEKTYKQLTQVLTDLGVEPIEAVGAEFDPNLHNAVMHVDDENVGENIVVEEFQKGYKYKDTIVRHSMVKVAN